MTLLYKIQLRRDTAANWTLVNPTLASGEYGYETDTGRFKNGDGATAWADLRYESALAPTGTKASPTVITAAGGITAADEMREYQFIVGVGATTITAVPQISAGSVVGQELVLQGTSNVNTVSIADGNGLNLNGPCTLQNGSAIYLIWDGTVWSEVSRNDK